MKRALFASVAAAALLAACGDDDDATTGTTPYQLTFRGDGTFTGPHGGQQLRAALVRASDGAILDRQATTVGAAGADPSFSVTFAPMLDPAVAYRVHYWIDSNFGAGGTPGVCDPPANDHQWSLDLPMGQAVFVDTHRPAAIQSVCASFPALQLSFEGDGTFAGPHAGQALQAALLRTSDGAVLDLQSTTVGATGSDPSFSVTFAPMIDAMTAFTVHYWVDSNFGVGGTVGVCDPPANDHQWSVPIPMGQATFTDTHRPTETSSVCDTFPALQLTFEGDGTFTGAHGGHQLRAALVRVSDSAILDRQATTVGMAPADPSFSVTFTPALDPAAAYRVHYWIDSNFGVGGTPGVCDPPANDHQWSVDIPVGQGTLTDTHRPAATESVCASFPALQLTFEGDGTFTGAHGGQALEAALLRTSDGAILDRQATTVGMAPADPSFSVTFAPMVDAMTAFTVHYWIDSNFGGGTVGVCDPPANDHQWSVPIPMGQAAFTDTHRPTETSSVCASFP